MKLIRLFFSFIVFSFFAAGPVDVRSETMTQSDCRLPSVRLDTGTAELLDKAQWQAALEELISASQAPGSEADIRYYISFCYYQLGKQAHNGNQFGEAIDLFNNALTYTRDIPAIFLSLGLSHLKQSEYEKAECALEEAVRLDPSLYWAYRQLGEIAYNKNNVDTALQHWNRALELNDTDAAFRKRVDNQKKQLNLIRGHEIQSDYQFFISFDGDINPCLGSSVSKMLDDMYFSIGEQLNAYPKRQIAVVLMSRNDFVDVTNLPDWVSGIYEGQIKIPVANSNMQSLKPVLAHEYVHAVIYDIMSSRCPWWLNEGLAQYFSTDENGNRQKMQMAAEWIRQCDVPDLKSLPGTSALSTEAAKKYYSLALSATCFLIETVQLYNLQEILAQMGQGSSFDSALESTTGYAFSEFESYWLSFYR